MKTLSLTELKALSLEILEDFDRFCRSRNINYSLGYGTLLGAVRHKGFIPWDDDIDVMMPREDYERFRAEYTSGKFRFIDQTVIPDCWINFGRICDTSRTVALSTIPWHGPSCSTGVWIDIFPVDKVPDDNTFSDLFFTLFMMHKMSVRCRRVHTDPRDCPTLLTRFKTAIHTRIHPTFTKISPVRFTQARESAIRLCNKKGSATYSQIACTDYSMPQCFSARMLSEYCEYDFEGHRFMGWKDYDSILKIMYGDYMKLPPENKRKPLQNYIRFCWK
ncbi:MAG: phosphorylcholine transferase LicD [Candidatus Cryptobacteroides sp.]